MTKTENRVTTTDADIDAALAQAKIYDGSRPRAVAAAYQKAEDRLDVTLSTGVQLLIPRKLLQGLEDAAPAQVATVQVEDHGSSLRWEALDVDHYVPGLVEGIFGTRTWMSVIGTKGGSMRSEAKTKAVRENGLKGGRPPTGRTDARYRDIDGIVRVKNGNTPVSALRNVYGDTFAPGIRGDMKLDTLLQRSGVRSLSDFQKKQAASR